MITIPNQSSVAKAHEQFDEAGRMRPSPYYDRLVDVMEELLKFTYLTRCPITSRAGIRSARKRKAPKSFPRKRDCRPYDCDAILTRAAKRSNSMASRCAVWSFETLRRASPAKDAPVAPLSYLLT